MTHQKAKQQSVIDGPRESGKFTLYPASVGLIGWLMDIRKNPALVGGKIDIKHIGELCFSFTMPSEEVCAIPTAKISARVQKFMHSITDPSDFTRMQKHAQNECTKYFATAAMPKKKPIPPRQKVKR